MKAVVETGDGLTRKVNVTVPAEEVGKEMDRQMAEVRKEANLKGFRKGKAPLNMIKSIYGDRIKADVADTLFRSSFANAIKENELRVATTPTVSAMDFPADGTFTYTVEIEVFPEIGKIDYDNLEVVTQEIDVTDKEVDEFIEHLQKQKAEIRELSRPAGETDIIVADLIKLSDSKGSLPESEFSDSRIDLGSTMTIKEFKEYLPGMKAGEEKEIEVVYPDDYPDEMFSGSHIKYLCKVKSINERILPPYDDAFAKSTGQAETALELRMKIRDNIRQQKEDGHERILKRQVVSQMCKKNALPIPDGMLNEYLDHMVKDPQVQQQGGDEKELRERYRPVAMDTIRWDIIWHRLAEDEKIEVLPEDTEKWIKDFAARHNITVEQASQSLKETGRTSQLREAMLEEKVMKFLLDKAKKVPFKDEEKK